MRRGKEPPIYNRLQVLRAERTLSRAALAAAVEVNPQTIGALERGDHYPSLDLAFRICGVFDLPVEGRVRSRAVHPAIHTGLPRGGK
jgi:putative transcriptional regulator